jgi:PAS domain S-box-containing protein
MIAFFLAIVLFGVAMTAVSHHVLRHTLAQAELSDAVVEPIGRQFIQTLTGLTLAGMVVAIGIAALLSRTITAPIKDLLDGVTQIGSGNLDAVIRIPSDDEFGRLAAGFNKMASVLKQSHSDLEAKVTRRTAELSEINRMLSHEVERRTRIEEDLRESLSLHEATLDATADGILVVDAAGRIKSFNRKFQDLWQLPDEVLASGDEQAALAIAKTRFEDPEAFLAEIRDLYRHHETESQGAFHLRDGRIVEYYSKPQVIDREIVGRVLSFRDVTERNLSQDRQAKLLERVAEINEELSHFAYVVSHDLKAPLRGIKLITEWLCADYGEQLGEDAREQLDLLQSRVERMHNLIDGVLQYSRVGRIKEEIVPVDCNVLLTEVLDAIAPPDHIEIQVEGELPTIQCEKTRMAQVLQNLLTNAVKYMDKPEGHIAVGCVQEGSSWRFHVRDNGPGIDAKHFDRIFRIFQTLTPRDEFESTGVGLTLVKKIVEMYGGRVWVESELGRGSNFFFTLPENCQEPVNDGAAACPDLATSRPAPGVLLSCSR